MHDLNTINGLNERAFQRGVAEARRYGPVVVVKHGLHIVRFDRASTDIEAAQKAQEIERQREPGTTVEILPKLGAAEAALLNGRDQSEDYAGREVVVFTQANADAPVVRSTLAA